ncbi:MAG: hypothetical protein ACXWJW_15565 [Xanthobacteraceae bacterium]
MAGKVRIFGLVCGLLAPALAQAFETREFLAEKLEELSLPLPTPSHVVVCHGFACRYHTEIGLGSADQARLTQLLAHGRANPSAERLAIAQAIAWFEKRFGAEAGTSHAIARSNRRWPLGDPGQFDCIDTSTNTMELFLLLDELHLLHHHRLAMPVSRHLFVDGEPHTTAVLAEVHSGQRWAFDPWTHNNGELPDVLPVDVWLELD